MYDQKVFGCYFLPFNCEELPWKYQKINKGFCLLCPKQEGNGHLYELASYARTPTNHSKILLAKICEKLAKKKKKRSMYSWLMVTYLRSIFVICHYAITRVAHKFC